MTIIQYISKLMTLKIITYVSFYNNVLKCLTVFSITMSNTEYQTGKIIYAVKLQKKIH